MQPDTWRAGLTLAAGALIACGGSSSTPVDGGGDDDGSRRGDGSSQVIDAAPDDGTCARTALTELDAGACWGCLRGACSDAVRACATECTCNDALGSGLACAADGGATARPACLAAAVAAHPSDPLVNGVFGCLTSMGVQQCAATCGVDAGVADTPTKDD